MKAKRPIPIATTNARKPLNAILNAICPIHLLLPAHYADSRLKESCEYHA
ncbi:hypothetical protein FORC065_1450 [Yersinia enterocolitica]|nr:hypothetical protein FORC065_1450 [Yersinia enterocolitica]